MADVDDTYPEDANLAQQNATDDASYSQQDAQESLDGSGPFRFVHSHQFPDFLESLGATLLVSTYQAGKLVAFRASEGRLSMLLRTFDKAMGLAVQRDRIAVGTTYQIWQLCDSPEVAAKMKPAGKHDACFLPRWSHVTGNIDIHEIAWGEVGGQESEVRGRTPELWVVNTLFSCLCTVEPDYSFVPRWRPPFVTQLRRHDRCHLNGMAMVDGLPGYVTAFGETDTPEGWRPGKVDGGVVIDVASGETVARGLSMPHSPRMHNGRLWLLDSGRGRLCVVDPASGKIDCVAQLPGYTRGLAFVGPFALVGLSKIREKAIFGGVPIAERQEERKCGVWIVDTRNGRITDFLDFQQSVEEIFDVELLHGVRFPEIVGFQKDTVQRACVIAAETPIAGYVSHRRLASPDEATSAAVHNRQGLMLIRQKRFDEALAELQTAIKLKPDYAEAHNNLGNALLGLSRREDAIVAYRTAVRIKPEYAKAWSNLGHSLTQLEKYEEAEKACRRAVEIDPDYAIAHNHLGNVLRARKEFENALASYQQAVRLKPDYPLALCNLGGALRDLWRLEEAEQSFRAALRLQPDMAEAYVSLGNTLADQDRLDEARDCLRAALEISPDDPSPWNDLGLTLQALGQWDEAQRHFEQSLERAPDSERVHLNLAYLLLAQGQFQPAWPHFEWRWKDKSPADPPLTQPRWDGSPLNGRTLVLHSEQTLGDTITIDVNAAGHGWFIDVTPHANEEFSGMSAQGLVAAGDSAAAGQMDLLSVVLHELGHVLDLPDLHSDVAGDSIMSESLAAGIRRLPTEGDLAALRIGSS